MSSADLVFLETREILSSVPLIEHFDKNVFLVPLSNGKYRLLIRTKNLNKLNIKKTCSHLLSEFTLIQKIHYGFGTVIAIYYRITTHWILKNSVVTRVCIFIRQTFSFSIRTFFYLYLISIFNSKSETILKIFVTSWLGKILFSWLQLPLPVFSNSLPNNVPALTPQNSFLDTITNSLIYLALVKFFEEGVKASPAGTGLAISTLFALTHLRKSNSGGQSSS